MLLFNSAAPPRSRQRLRILEPSWGDNLAQDPAAHSRFVLLTIRSSRRSEAYAQAAGLVVPVRIAGDADRSASDFLAVIDANPSSKTYGQVVSRAPIGTTGTMPHHVEYEFPADNHLFANGWVAGRSFIFDLNEPVKPRIVMQFAARNGYTFPHSFVRLPNGHVLVTFQSHGAGYAPGGGLVELNERGEVVRSASAVDPAVSKDLIWPYSLAVAPKLDVAVESMTPMGMPEWAKLPIGSWPKKQIDEQITAHLQVWRLSDLTLIKTIELPGDNGKHNQWPAEPRLLADGTVYVNTFSCGLYRMKDLGSTQPSAEQVFIFPGSGESMMTTCGVPVVVGHYWVQPAAALPGLIVLDIRHPEKPVEVSRLLLDHEHHMPHWLAADRNGDRLVLTGDNQSWVLVLQLNQNTGKLAIDETFHAEGASAPGVVFEGKEGRSLVHGAVFGPR